MRLPQGTITHVALVFDAGAPLKDIQQVACNYHLVITLRGVAGRARVLVNAAQRLIEAAKLVFMVFEPANDGDELELDLERAAGARPEPLSAPLHVVLEAWVSGRRVCAEGVLE